MKKIIALVILLALVAGVAWLVRQRGAEERAVRRVVEEAQVAALTGLNRGNPNALNVYFATEAEGAQSSGLVETEQAYKDFMAQLPTSSSVQFHSFVITAVDVHEDRGIARVAYRLHFSVVRGTAAIYSAQAAQNLALLKTARGWRISGGDAPQLEDVTGAWPPR
jgi:hypothetical protein